MNEGYFPLAKSVCRGCVILGEALRRPELFPTILGLYSILGVGLGPGIKWARVVNDWGPTIAPQNSAARPFGRGGGFWLPRRIFSACWALPRRQCYRYFSCFCSFLFTQRVARGWIGLGRLCYGAQFLMVFVPDGAHYSAPKRGLALPQIWTRDPYKDPGSVQRLYCLVVTGSRIGLGPKTMQDLGFS